MLFDLFRQHRRLRDLDERLTKAEGDLKAAQLDWDNLYDKCRRLLGRTVKERATIESATQPAETLGAVEQVPGNGRLSSHQLEVQQKILRRRAGL